MFWFKSFVYFLQKFISKTRKNCLKLPGLEFLFELWRFELWKVPYKSFLKIFDGEQNICSRYGDFRVIEIRVIEILLYIHRNRRKFVYTKRLMTLQTLFLVTDIRSFHGLECSNYWLRLTDAPQYNTRGYGSDFKTNSTKQVARFSKTSKSLRL